MNFNLKSKAVILLFNLVYSVLFNLDLTLLFNLVICYWISISNFIHSISNFIHFNSKNMQFILFLWPINSFELFILLFILSKDWPMLFYSRIFLSPRSSLARIFLSPRSSLDIIPGYIGLGTTTPTQSYSGTVGIPHQSDHLLIHRTGWTDIHLADW